MADNIFTQLGRLFQSNVIIRKKDDNRLVVRDLDYTQTALQSNFIERYNNMIQKDCQDLYCRKPYNFAFLGCQDRQ